MTRKPPKPEHDPEAMWNMTAAALEFTAFVTMGIMLAVAISKLI